MIHLREIEPAENPAFPLLRWGSGNTLSGAFGIKALLRRNDVVGIVIPHCVRLISDADQFPEFLRHLSPGDGAIVRCLRERNRWEKNEHGGKRHYHSRHVHDPHSWRG